MDWTFHEWESNEGEVEGAGVSAENYFIDVASVLLVIAGEAPFTKVRRILTI